MKMCAYCGKKVKDNKVYCPYCHNKLAISERQQNIINFIKIFKLISLCIIVVLVIFIPALIIMIDKYPLMKPKENLCIKNCGLFSYDYAGGKRYCVCKNSEVYNNNTGSFIYNKDDALNDLLDSNKLSDLKTFYSQYENGENILLVVKNNKFNYVNKQENALINFGLNYKIHKLIDVKLHYVDLNKLSDNDIFQINKITGVDLSSKGVFVIVIKDREVVYNDSKSIFYFSSDYLYDLIYDYLVEL